MGAARRRDTVDRHECRGMRDVDIRRQLRVELGREYGDDPNTLIVDELGVEEGSFRVDVAVVNGSLHGYEIKSAIDTLVRLPGQLASYGRVFELMTLVASRRHADAASGLVPSWWGVVIADAEDEAVVLTEERAPSPNPSVDPYAVAQLLWRDEALELLKERGLARGLRSKPRRELWVALAVGVERDDLCAVVRERLRRRRTWRADSP